MDAETDERLRDVLERFVAGDGDAFEVLFRRHQVEIYGWIMRMVRNHAVAEDLTVETFWRAYRSRGRFDPGRPFGAWVRRIATNVAITWLKHSSREVALASDVPAPPALDPDTRERILAAFHSLPARLQAAATLAIIEEVPQAEIAAALGISLSAVKARVFRATHLLRRKLRRLGIEP